MTIGELLIELGFKADTKNLQGFIKDLGELNLASVVSATGLIGLTETIKGIMETADKATIAFRNLSGITGVSAKTFQAWDNTAQEFGVTVGTTSSEISKIQQAILELETTGTGIATTWGAILGVQPQGRENDPAGVLTEILTKLQQLPLVERRRRLELMGINSEMLLMVDHVNEIHKTLTLQGQDFKAISEAHRYLTQLSNDFLIIVGKVAAILEPILKPMIDGLIVIFEFANKLLTVFQAWIAPLLIVAGVVAGLMGLINPLVAIIGVGLAGAGLLKEQFDLKNQLVPSGVGGSNLDQSRQFSIRQEYNINSNNPEAVADAIREHWQRTTREADLMGYQQNY